MSVDGDLKFALGSADEQEHWQGIYRDLIARVMQESGRDAGGVSVERLPAVGVSVPRNDALYKVRGRAKYAANLFADGLLHGKFVRSPHPRARILKIDVAEARRVPGVHAVLTAADIPADKLMIGNLENDTPILAKDNVRFVGEPVVAIAAESLEAASAACDLVEIEYEELTPVLTCEEALADGAPKVDDRGNIIGDYKKHVGDVDAAIAQAHVVVERTFTTEPIDHCFLEAQTAFTFVNEHGVLTQLTCSQYPHYLHKLLARVTELPMDKVHVIQTVVGGGFGGKIDVTIECVSALMTLQAKRPIRMALTREEVFAVTTKRHKMTIRERLAADASGRFTACDVHVLADGGAYRSYSPIVAGRVMVHAGMPYEIPNLRAVVTTTFTNHAPSGAMRSFGVVKINFAHESLVNEIAHKLKMSPIALRRLNGFRDDSTTGTGQTLKDVGLGQTFDVVERFYLERKAAIAAEVAQGKRVGLGIAAMSYGIGYTGTPNPSVFTLSLRADGNLNAFCGTPDIGNGSDTALAQIVADAVGVSVARIQMITGDSISSEDAGPTSASRLTYFCGNAAYESGQELKRKFAQAFAAAIGRDPGTIRIENDEVVYGNEHMSFEEACERLGDDVAEVTGRGAFNPEAGVNLKTFMGNPYPTYAYATHMAEVEIDEEIGSVNVRRYWAVHDAGTVVNRVIAEGQVEGGVAMGLGMALWEKVARADGHTLNPSYRDYLLPGPKDMPPEMVTIFTDSKERTGPFGAKGFAETTLIPIPAAVGGAIADALGIWPTRLPMESEYILQLIQEKKQREAA
ncbi:MAG: xanthine dehydrogenase family protein molybdopterin-binding subunit [Alphaproteobacteria bacterium]